MIKKLFAAAIFAAFGAAIAAPISHVAVAARVYDGTSDTGWNPTVHYEATPGNLTQAALLPGGQSSGWATSGPGYAKALAQASTHGGAYSIGFASGSYSELITLSAPGMEGQAGRLTATFLLDYSLIATAPDSIAYLHFSGGVGRSAGNLVLSALHDGTTQFLGGTYEINDALGYRRLPEGGVSAMSITSDFIWGQAFNVDYRMLVQAQAYGPLAASAIVDASHSAYWGGLSAVSAGGQMVTDYSVTSESGADYSRSFAPGQGPTPVPEPTTISLMLAGAYLITRVTRSRAAGR